MNWEFRVVESQYKVQVVDNETHEFIENDYFTCYGIAMCKVDENGDLVSTDGNFVSMGGGDLRELKINLQEALEALDKPVIKLNK